MNNKPAAVTLDDLPIKIQRLIRNLRQECSLHRLQKNEARAEVAELRAELAALKAETGR